MAFLTDCICARGKLRRFDRINVRQVPRQATECPALVAAAPDLAGRRAEIEAGGLTRIRGHGLALDRPPRLRLGQTLILSLPGASAIPRAIHRRAATRRRPRPDACAL